jgi:Na+/H+-dicarboxylate symporter
MSTIGFLSSMLEFNKTMFAVMIAVYLAQDNFGKATNETGDDALSMIIDRFTRGKSKEFDKSVS